MLKRLIITLIGLATLIGLPALIKLKQFEAMGAMSMEMPPETVTADKVRRANWPDTLSATGSLVAVQGVTIGAELGGKVVEIAFESGDRVKVGDLLLRLDVSAEEAQLRSAEAAAKLARIYAPTRPSPRPTWISRRPTTSRPPPRSTTCEPPSPRRLCAPPSTASWACARSIWARSSNRAQPSSPCRRSIRSMWTFPCPSSASPSSVRALR